MERHWDPQGKYADNVLKVYESWSLEVSARQHTLACFIIFCRRPAVRLMSELCNDELVQLRVVMCDIQSALLKHSDIKPDHFNYLQMGNALPSLHLHGIPRYETPRALLGRMWTDETWGKPPAWSMKSVPKGDIEGLRKAILPFL